MPYKIQCNRLALFFKIETTVNSENEMFQTVILFPCITVRDKILY